MRLYEYSINIKDTLICSEHDGYEEKAKTYYREKGYPARVYKDSIGNVSSDFLRPKLWLLERDDKRAKKLIADYYSSLVEKTKSDCEDRCLKYTRIIRNVGNSLN